MIDRPAHIYATRFQHPLGPTTRPYFPNARRPDSIDPIE
jgi:hypothetical protein